MITALLSTLALAQIPGWEPPVLVPPVRMAQPRFAPFVMPDEVRVVATAEGLGPLAAVLAEHLGTMTGRPVSVGAPPAKSGDILLTQGYLADGIAGNPEGFAIEVFSDHVAISGDTPSGAARGAARALQLLSFDGESDRWSMPAVRVEDAPGVPWRGMMLDLARFPHPVEAVEEAIDLAYLFSLNTVHLHLSDNQAFTFPLSILPPRTDPGKDGRDRGYSPEDIARIVRFADARSITLIPEIDMPAHSSALLRARPDLFGTVDAETGEPRGTGVIHMASERAYGAVEAMLAEVAAAFPTSPMIHIGGDEVWAPHLLETVEFAAYAKEHGIEGEGAMGELLDHFLQRTSRMVKELGRQPVVWEGFRPPLDEAHAVPGDVIVMGWSQHAQLPEALAAQGYPLVNCGWNPLYVVPAQGYAASPTEAWNWNARSFRQRYGGRSVDLAEKADVRGAQICVWEQRPEAITPALLRILPELSTRMWGSDLAVSAVDFRPAAKRVQDTALRVLRPATVQVEGLATTVGTLFEDKAQVILGVRPNGPAGTLRYRIDPDYSRRVAASDAAWDGKPITVEGSAVVQVALFDDGGEMVGYPRQVRLERGTPVLVFEAFELPAAGQASAEMLRAARESGAGRIGDGVLFGADGARLADINRELFARVDPRAHVDLRPVAFSNVAEGQRIDPLRPRIWGRHAVYAEGQLEIPEGGEWTLTASSRSALTRILIGGQLAIEAVAGQGSAVAPLSAGTYRIEIEHAVPDVHSDLQATLTRAGGDPIPLGRMLVPLGRHVSGDDLKTLDSPFQ